MPHSNDRTVVSAAGDKQIRVFDIEYCGRSAGPIISDVRSSTRAEGLVHQGVRYLGESDTNARVYRSHSDRVKRIVTESSPHLFLSCSEDGEVRQWDLRQPSAAYPYPRNRNGWTSVTEDNNSGVPPPLISYKRHNLDINTISCSPSQPHYIALGGAHLHCFLHDRRMLGRDKHNERGLRAASDGSSDHDDNQMSEATQCVRRFAPHGQAKMKATSTGHITACKISDANPNELIASWSSDSIYSFDLVRSPDAREEQSSSVEAGSKMFANGKVKSSRDRKRKRTQRLGTSVVERASRRAEIPLWSHQARGSEHDEDGNLALRVRYENGQSESIPIRQAERDSVSLSETAESSMAEADRRPSHIANTSVEIRKTVFTLAGAGEVSNQDPTGHGRSFASALGSAASVLDDMDDIMRTWRYPVSPENVDVVFQTTLRRHREATRRFVQAAGTISRVLGGKLQTAGGRHAMIDSFVRVELAPNESRILDESEQFRYDFIKAICLWLDSGVGAVLEGFTGPRRSARFPIHEDASIESIDDVIIPYLLRMATDTPVMNVDASRFEIDENHQVFGSETAAVLAFARAIKIPFEDLSRAESSPSAEQSRAQDRKTALRFWGMKVARGLLLKAAESVTHFYVDQAFGGLGRTPALLQREEARQTARQTVIDSDEEDPMIEAIAMEVSSRDPNAEEQAFDEDMIPIDNALAAAQWQQSQHPHHQEAEEAAEDGDEAELASDDADSSSDEDSASEPEEQLYRYRGGGRTRHTVNPRTPCFPHHRIYSGHCNVKTVKDVNFYGLNDEYVVSGSDDGNLFIWDRQTAELVNILEGDGEVVNVVQGHPYEPILAVSGIDSTVKIFGCDARARRDAYRGIGVQASDDRNFSSLNFGMRRRASRRRRAQSSQDVGEEEPSISHFARDVGMTPEPAALRASRHVDAYYLTDDSDNPDRPAAPENGLASRRRMKDAYRITAENDANKRSGQRDTYITRSMLAQLAARMGVTVRPQGGGEGDEDGDGGPVMMLGGPDGEQVVIGDDCCLM